MDAAAALDFLLFFEDFALADASAAGAPDLGGRCIWPRVSKPHHSTRYPTSCCAWISSWRRCLRLRLELSAVPASAFLLRFDFFVVDESAVAAELSVAAASAFLLFFVDFFVVELSAAAAELSVEPASAFLDFFFLVVVVL